ncbi:phage minor tail protein L, partial [Escherichia coli EC1869]|jgi:hypothetical protein
MRLS